MYVPMGPLPVTLTLCLYGEKMIKSPLWSPLMTEDDATATTPNMIHIVRDRL